MDNNFYRDDFEHMLREKADEFKLQPRRRVWHSIYNGMHPSRKWPSVIISLLLITSLVYIGYLNSNNENKALTENKYSDKTKMGATSISSITTTPPVLSNLNNSSSSNITISEETDVPENNSSSIIPENTIAGNTTNTQASSTGIFLNQDLTTSEYGVAKNDQLNISPNSSISSEKKNTTSNQVESINTDSKLEVSADSKTSGSSEINGALTAAITSQLSAEINKSITAQNDKAWIENFAFYNKSGRKKWKDRMAYSYYVTPGISYRMLKSNIKYPSPVPVNALQNSNSESYAINQIPSLSAEIGAALIYSFAKNIRVKAGVQFNYTSYGIKAYETNHPILTTLTLNDLNSGYPYLESRNTSIANISAVGGSTLHNKTYQVSLPVGVEFKLAGKERLQWYAGATVQPTYIIGGRSYLLSSDNKNYVADNSMIRKWSFNTGVETFISFKTNHSTTIQIGPQVRLQVPSTYGKKYSMDEKLFSAGLKFGVVRNF